MVVFPIYRDMSHLQLPWRSIDVDDYVCEWRGLCLRVEQMDLRQWWYCVHTPNDERVLHGCECVQTYEWPPATTWQDACYFAELMAMHYDKHGNFELYYLQHAPSSKRQQKRFARRVRGARFADFPWQQ